MLFRKTTAAVLAATLMHGNDVGHERPVQPNDRL